MKKLVTTIPLLIFFIAALAQKNSTHHNGKIDKKTLAPNTSVPTKKDLTNKKIASIPIVNELKQLWNSSAFLNENKYFWLYNYNFFRFLDENELKLSNETPYRKGLTVFAVADFNGDREPHAYLMYNSNGCILVKGLLAGDKAQEPIQIAISLADLFHNNNIASCLIAQKDKAFWEWNELSFNSGTFSNEVPKGVLPTFDLRTFIRDSLPGTFLTYQEEFNFKNFSNYFNQFGVDSLIPKDFAAFRTTDKKLLGLIDKINEHLGEEVFKLIEFNPSGYWGIANYKKLNEEQKLLIMQYGLLSNAKEIAKLFPD